ncbi:MAG TPA: amino acid ABC transporter substrate-binding protein [Streptosporangiaceae bacterium]
MKLNGNALGRSGRRGRAAAGWAAGATALALVAAACGSSNSSGSGGGNSSQPITVGVSVSLSGDFSGDGLATKQGYQTWAAYQNAHGGIMGRQIKINFLSDGSSPTQVVTNYQKLITVDHVDFVAGPYSTLLTKPSSAIANRYGKVMIEGIGGGPSVFQQGLQNVFDVSASAKDQLVTFARWLASTQKTQSVAYATMTDPFLQPMVDNARTYLTAHGFTSALYKLYPVETTDFTPIASAIAASKAQVVVLGSMPPDGYALIQDLIQDKYSPKILIEASGPDQGAAFVKAVGAKNTGGLMVPNTWFPGSTYYQNAAMVQQYLKMFGGTADNISTDVAEAFATGQVLTQAVDHLKSTDNAALQSYLHSNVTFQSVQGPVKFASDGENAAATPYVFQWQKGTLQDVLPAGVGNPVPVLATKPAWGAGG